MKRILLLASATILALILQGCAVYATPYGYSPGYYGYAPYYGFGFNYWPHSYYSYRPGFSPGYHYRGWGGGPRWGGHGGWGGRGGWRGR